MKFLFSTLCLFLVAAVSASAQGAEEVDAYLSSLPDPGNADYGQAAIMRGTNSIELGFGMPQFNAYIMDIDMFDQGNLILDFGTADMMCHEWFQDEYVLTRRRCTWAFNANYMRAISWWLQVGASLSSSAYEADYENGYTRDHAFTEKSFVLSCIPTARFNFRNRENFSLYSEFGAGFYFLHEKDHHYRSTKAKPKNNECNFMTQLTFLGVRVGSKFYVYGELGIGPKGFLNTGVGYRF